MKTLAKIFALAIALFSLNSCLVGKYMCNYVLVDMPDGQNIERTRHKADSLLAGSTAWYDGLKEKGILKDITVKGYGDVDIHACYVPAANPGKAAGTAVVVHGFGDNHFVFLYLVRMYRDELNYNVLFPDLQYHGYSGGDHTTMGWYDRYDVTQWVKVAHDIFKDDFMVVHGVSMGAATTMMMSGDEQPEYLRAYVEDCGYSSVWNQLKFNLKDSFHLPPFPVLTSASIVCKDKYGFSFKEASSMDQLAKCDRPMLFIHGDADDFVPFSHLQQVYDAKTSGYKEMWVAEGAVHANSFQSHPEEYKAHVKAFLDKVKKENL